MEQLSDVMTDIMFPPADAVSLTKNDSTETDDQTGWKLEAYFEQRPDMSMLENVTAQNDAEPPLAEEELPDIDWVAHSLKGLTIVRCGRFILHGAHDQENLTLGDGDIPIQIDANQAFGTGHHPTTAGCLEVLDGLTDLAPKNILDLGTGSAILAIAAAKLWPSHVLATDIDATSVEIAVENAALNGTPDISFLTAAGFEHETIASTAPFDFVFANILAGPLQELAPAMAAHTSPGATVILAGLLANQEEAVTSSYLAQGFTLQQRHDHDTWPVLVFTR